MRTSRGFSLIEVAIAGTLFAMLMLAVMGLLSQAQNDLSKTASKTEVDEKIRRALETVTRELSESSFNMIIAGGRQKSGGPGVTSNYVTITGDPGLIQCPDQFCPWNYNPTFGVERVPEAFLARSIRMSDATGYVVTNPGASLSLPVSNQGRVWMGGGVPGSDCLAGHNYSSVCTNTADVGIIAFATPRNAAGTYISREGTDLAPDWQGLVFYAPYVVGGNVMELRKYVFYVDDLVNGDPLPAYDANPASPTFGTGVLAPPAGVTITTSGAGPANGPWPANNPAGKPTIRDLLDYDADGAIADGILDANGGTADATTEVLQITTVAGQSVISYVKRSVGGTSTFDFSLTINRRTGDLTCAVTHLMSGSPAATYQKTVTVQGRFPITVISRLTDIEFADVRNCGYDATNNPTGMASPADANVVRITCLLDRLMHGRTGGTLGPTTITQARVASEIVTTKVQPRN